MSVQLEQVVVGNTVLVDGSAVTQPVSGAVSVSNFPATQPVSGTVAVNNFPATQPVSGTVTVANPGLTDTQLRATAVPVSGTVAVSNFPGASSGTATVTNVSVGTSSLTLSASNVAKTKIVIWNEAGTLFVKLGSTASASSYSYRLTANAVLELSGYYGLITAVKASGTSAVLVTEIGI